MYTSPWTGFELATLNSGDKHWLHKNKNKNKNLLLPIKVPQGANNLIQW